MSHPSHTPEPGGSDPAEVVLRVVELPHGYTSSSLVEHDFTIDELRPKLVAIAKANPDPALFLRADGAVPYEKVAQLMALCTQAGIAKMGMVTQPGVGLEGTGAEEDE